MGECEGSVGGRRGAEVAKQEALAALVVNTGQGHAQGVGRVWSKR